MKILRSGLFFVFAIVVCGAQIPAETNTPANTNQIQCLENCLICLSPIDNKHPKIDPYIAFACNHTQFHGACLQEWITKNSPDCCPLCGAPAISQVVLPDAGVNNADINGNTILMLAVMNNDINLVRQLLDVIGIDLNHKNKADETALLLALLHNRTEIAALLIAAATIDFSYISCRGNTYLAMAIIYNNHIRIIDQLLAKDGIDVNCANRRGDTALMLAVRANRIDIVRKFLAKNGIGINLVNTRNNTALSLAAGLGLTHIKDLLKANGAT